MAFTSLADLVKAHESGGNYQARNPGSTASGAYQFTNSTWRQYAGPEISRQYPTAADAPPEVQDQVFATAVQRNGLGDWTCPGCNPKLSAYLARNPDQASLPTFSGDATPAAQPQAPAYWTGTIPGTNIPAADRDPSTLDNPVPVYPDGTTGSGIKAGTTIGVMGAGQPGYLPPSETGGPAAFGLVPGLAAAINSWITDIENRVGTVVKNALGSAFATVANLALRFWLILLAIILIVVALWRLADPDGKKTMALVKSAKAA